MRVLDVWRNSLTLLVRPRAGIAQDVVMDDVMAAMRARRGLRPGDRNTFYLIEQDRIMDPFNQLFGAIFAVGPGRTKLGGSGGR